MDKYQLPDEAINFVEIFDLEYTAEEMLPLTKDKAFELYEADLSIFALYPDGTEAMIDNVTEIDSHAWFFGVEKEDWENFCSKYF